MIDGLLILLFFQFLGEVVIRLTGIPLPASVVGMVLLLLALLLNVPFSQRVAPAAGALIKHISLLIFPLGVGIVLQWHRYEDSRSRQPCDSRLLGGKHGESAGGRHDG